METVPVSIDVPKEAKEVVDFLDAVLEKVLAKAPLVEYAELVDEASLAVAGLQAIKDELASDKKDELAAYLIWKIMGRLVK